MLILTNRLLYMQSLLVSSRTLITLVSKDDGEQDKLLLLELLLLLVICWGDPTGDRLPW